MGRQPAPPALKSRVVRKRKTTPSVIDGKVVPSGRWPSFEKTPQPAPVIDRRRPGKSFLHLLKKADVRLFLELVPGWHRISEGLDAIVLSPGCTETYGWHIPGVVHVGAWPRDLWEVVSEEFLDDNADILGRLEVPVAPCGDDYWLKWTWEKARAFQLLDVLLHELGHHHDRMTTPTQFDIARGERFADEFAQTYRDLIWDDFLHHFDL